METNSPRTNRYISAYITSPNFFSVRECNQIINLSEFKTFKEDNNLITKSFTALTKKHWLKEKLNALINHTNQTYYDFDISIIKELYLLEFKKDSIIDWHIDIGPGLAATRKICFFTFLSENNNYEGGSINFCLNKSEKEYNEKEYIEQNIGTTVLIPAYKPYIFEKITKGTNFILNGYMHGNSFS